MDKQLWKQQLIEGKVGWHKLPEEWSENDRAETRREALVSLVGKPELAERIIRNGVMEAAAGKNAEQMIGEVTVPLSVAGPLVFQGRKSEVFVPLSTTEGALVASIQRGMKAIKLAGGVTTIVTGERVTRAPVFETLGLIQSQETIEWIGKHFEELKKMAEATSSHLKLQLIEPTCLGKNLWLTCEYETGEAMGMNMVTIATKIISEEIAVKCGISCIALSGNLCVDKKPAWINVIKGRGISVQAEIELSAELVTDVLKTKPERMIEVVQRKDWLGSMMAGAMAFNGHFANIVAALFLATGQDLGHIVEGSLGITTAELVGSNLYFSVALPDLMVGTVGGGTGLPVQKACLELMGLGAQIEGEKQQLAAIIAGTVLAGELSLTAALASHDLARAHQRLGRMQK